MLSRIPEGRGSQPVQRGADRDHHGSEKRVRTTGVGQQSERFPMVSPVMRPRGRGVQGYSNMVERGQQSTGGQHVSPVTVNNNNMHEKIFLAVTVSSTPHTSGSSDMGSMTSISGMGEATPIVADRAQMPPEWQQEFDDTACRQDQLIREWLRVTSNSDDKSRHFLQHTRWILRDAVEMY